MSDKYKYFIIEAEEILADLTKSLLDLDKNFDNPGLIKTIFRYTHTLKGAASMVKLTAFSSLAHKMEDRLADLRDKKKDVGHGDITLLLGAVTALEEIFRAIQKGDSEECVDLSKILKSLDNESNNIIFPPEIKKIGTDIKTGIKTTHSTKTQAVKNSKKSKKKHDSHETIRIPAQDMNKLSDMASEIRISHRGLRKNMEDLFKVVSKYKKIEQMYSEKNSGKIIETCAELNKQFSDMLLFMEQGFDRASSFSCEMDEVIMKTRLMSVQSYAWYFEKAVHDIAVETGKSINFVIKGKNLFLDRSLLEHIKEPVYHLIRNSIIHGVESVQERKTAGKDPQSSIRLLFERQNQSVKIICIDDGRGLDLEKIKKSALKKSLINKNQADDMSDSDVKSLILQSGLSTGNILTQLSGRGVGMDVIKNSVSVLNGTLDIDSKKGQFTRFKLTLPLSISIADAFMVTCAGQNLLIPLKFVKETRLLDLSEISSEAGRKVISFNGSPISLVSLADILGIAKADNHLINNLKSNKKLKIVIIKGNVDIAAIIVDSFGGIRSILQKPLTGQLGEIKSAQYSTILENGDPAFILNLLYIFDFIKGMPATVEAHESESPSLSILVTDDSLTTRTLISTILKKEGFHVTLSTSGEETLEILEKDSFDLFLNDVEMPGINGFELSEKIRRNKKHKDTPIIILSSLASDDDKQQGIEVGANAYIVKSRFDQEIFLETILSLI
jgi:two-component system, chemotaxis family, sensor kinase CheA